MGMINPESVVKRGMVLDAITASILEFRNGNKKALISLEQFLADVLGIDASRRIMDVVRENIDKDIPDIIELVDRKVLSEVIPYEGR